jgi:hypothetical protein
VAKTKKKYVIRAKGWIELPFFVGVEYRQRRSLDITGERVPVTLHVRNDLTKASSNDYLEEAESIRSFFEELRAKKDLNKVRSRILSSHPRYVTEAEARDLKKREPRLHCQRLPSVVEYTSRVSEEGHLPRELFPDFAFSWIDRVLHAYRRAVLPTMRYTIHPISEGNVSTTVYTYVLDRTRHWTHLTFDTKAGLPRRFYEQWAPDFDVENRFRALLRRRDNPLESTFTLAYPLFHQRQYREALVIAHGVFDQILDELIVHLAPDPRLGKILSKAHRGRSDDVFKHVLPALGAPSLPETNKELWDRFLEARNARHQAAHGSSTGTEKSETQLHPRALYDTIQWMIAQSGGRITRWLLDVQSKKTGEVLKPFP